MTLFSPEFCNSSSPDIDTQQPVSRQMEALMYDHYGSSPYWPVGAGLGAPMAGYPGYMPPADYVAAAPARVEERVGYQPRRSGDPHLRSAKEVTGYYVQGSDDEVGHVEDTVAKTLQGDRLRLSPRSLDRYLNLVPRLLRAAAPGHEHMPLEKIEAYFRGFGAILDSGVTLMEVSLNSATGLPELACFLDVESTRERYLTRHSEDYFETRESLLERATDVALRANSRLDTGLRRERLTAALRDRADHQNATRVRPVAARILAHAARLPALGAVPTRIVHGDLKISNVLFDDALERANALVDLDTLADHLLV